LPNSSDRKFNVPSAPDLDPVAMGGVSDA